MSVPNDKQLYNKIKTKIINKNSKNSAYRSGLIVKEYKKAYKEKYGNDNAYKGSKDKNEGLSRWFREKWRNQRGEIGYDKKGDIYRPTKRITKDTPKTFKELNKKEIKKAMIKKRNLGRVNKF